jgi:hypothetical protein
MILVGYRAKKSEFSIVLREGAGASDVIRAMLCVAHAHSLVSSDNTVNVAGALKQSLEFAKTNEEEFVQGIENKRWDVDAVFYGDRGIRSVWSRD